MLGGGRGLDFVPSLRKDRDDTGRRRIKAYLYVKKLLALMAGGGGGTKAKVDGGGSMKFTKQLQQDSIGLSRQ